MIRSRVRAAILFGTITGLAFLAGLTLAIATGPSPKKIPPLNKYVLFFPTVPPKEMIAAEVKLENGCSVFYTEGKPVAAVCMEHTLFYFGSVNDQPKPVEVN